MSKSKIGVGQQTQNNSGDCLKRLRILNSTAIEAPLNTTRRTRSVSVHFLESFLNVGQLFGEIYIKYNNKSPTHPEILHVIQFYTLLRIAKANALPYNISIRL